VQLKKLNEEASTLSDRFVTRLLAATKEAAYRTSTPDALAGLSPAQLAAAAQAASARQVEGYVLPLQNTTQQPALASLSVRTTRAAIFQNSWNRARAR
jgi:peptidyl-dipeptidase Dcp